MRSSAQDFIGTHNFNAFRSSACQGKNPVKTLDSFEITEEQDTITCHVKARSFLHNQVRIMVGTLVWVGIGKYPQHVVDELLKCGNRVKSGPTAPPHGLYLAAVGYANYP
jgi:tRNA pseudouridine38-40 synthase